jgi:transcriptional regulator with XRE-family HTH domain
MAGPSRTTGQRRLARELRRLREDAGFTIEQVADKLEISASTISRIETARVRVRPRDLRDLLDLYQVTSGQREEFLQIARDRRQQPWWWEYKDLPNVPLAGYEAEAASILQYSALLIPGLLQTRAYAFEVLRAIRVQDKLDDIEPRLQFRMDRQKVLTGPKSLQYWGVLDEAVLRRTVGGRQGMHAQLKRLIDAAALPNVTLQVLPSAVGAHAGMDGEFTILKYPEPADPDVVYIESTGGDLYVEETAVTRRYNLIFDHLRAAALDPAESIRTLVTIKDELQELERR